MFIKKFIKLISNLFQKEKNKNFELKKIGLDEFANLYIETKHSINWILRKPHLDLVTKDGKYRKVKQIVKYFQKSENMEMILSKLIITDTRKPFELPVQINENFWLKGNNFFVLPMIFQFRKNVTPYEEVNDYISKDKKPMLYSWEYYKNLPFMNDNEIEEFLMKNPIEIIDNTITSGRHRTLAMIGRLVEKNNIYTFMLMLNKNNYSKIKLKNLITRQIYTFKDKQVLDLELFKKDKYYLKKSDWDPTTVFLYTSVDNSIQNSYYQDPKYFKSMYERYMFETEQKEHSITNYDRLIDEFDLEILEKNKIIISHLENKFLNKKYVVVDGIHRLVILKNKFNIENINIKYFVIT